MPWSLPAVLAQSPEVDLEGLDEAIDTGGTTWVHWVTAAGLLAAGVLVAWLLGVALRRAFARRDVEGFLVDLVARLVRLVVVTVALVWSLATLGVRVGPLLGALGIAGIALAFALKDTLENFIAGLLLQTRRPFHKGDEIVVGDDEGAVVEVNARSVVIDTPDGERLFVPSSRLITEPIINLTRFSRRRTTLVVQVAYGTDLERARDVLQAALEAEPGALDVPPPEVRVEAFADSGIDVALRFWHEPRIADMWRVRDRVAVRAHAALGEAGIEIPFPQRVLRLAPGTQLPVTAPPGGDGGA